MLDIHIWLKRLCRVTIQLNLTVFDWVWKCCHQLFQPAFSMWGSGCNTRSYREELFGGGSSCIRCNLSGLPSDSLENPLKASCLHWLNSCCGGLKFKIEAL